MRDSYYSQTYFERMLQVQEQINKVKDLKRVLFANDIAISEWEPIEKYIALYNELEKYINVLRTGALNFVYQDALPACLCGISIEDPLILALKNIMGFMQITLHKGDCPTEIFSLARSYRDQIVKVTNDELQSRPDLQQHKSVIIRALNAIISLFTGVKNMIKPSNHKMISQACYFFSTRTNMEQEDKLHQVKPIASISIN